MPEKTIKFISDKVLVSPMLKDKSVGKTRTPFSCPCKVFIMKRLQVILQRFNRKQPVPSNVLKTNKIDRVPFSSLCKASDPAVPFLKSAHFLPSKPILRV